jgi:hypothetical protein
MSKALTLRVTRQHHTHAGKTYRVGDTFEGSQKLLDTFGDRLEMADTPKKAPQAADSAPSVPTPLPTPPTPPAATPAAKK